MSSVHSGDEELDWEAEGAELLQKEALAEEAAAANKKVNQTHQKASTASAPTPSAGQARTLEDEYLEFLQTTRNDIAEERERMSLFEQFQDSKCAADTFGVSVTAEELVRSSNLLRALFDAERVQRLSPCRPSSSPFEGSGAGPVSEKAIEAAIEKTFGMERVKDVERIVDRLKSSIDQSTARGGQIWMKLLLPLMSAVEDRLDSADVVTLVKRTNDMKKRKDLKAAELAEKARKLHDKPGGGLSSKNWKGTAAADLMDEDTSSLSGDEDEEDVYLEESDDGTDMSKQGGRVGEEPALIESGRAGIGGGSMPIRVVNKKGAWGGGRQTQQA